MLTGALWITWMAGCAAEVPTPAQAKPPAQAAPTPAVKASSNPWLAAHPTEGATPAGALRLWLDASIAFAEPSKRDAAAAALQYLTLPLKDDATWQTRSSNRTFVDRLLHQPHLFRSYAKGATPANGYAAPEDWTLHVDRVADKRDDRGTPLFVVSGGADSSRPVYMKQSTKTGLWYVNVWANTYVGIRPMVDPNAETFK